MKANTKKVHFNNTPSIIFEPLDISYYLQLSRISNFNQKRADKDRMEKLLTPILTTEHRCKMYLLINKIYDSQ